MTELSRNSRKRRLLLAALVVLMIAGLVSCWLAWRASNGHGEQTAEARYFSKASREQEQKLAKDLQRKLASAKSEEERRSILQTMPKAFRVYEMAKGLVREVDFVGRVVDQHGDGVPGARVSVLAGGAYFVGGSGPGNAVTDANGVFRLAGLSGASLIIQTITKDGYDVAVSRQPHGFWSFDDPGSRRVSWKRCTETAPCVFQAWRYPADAVGLKDILRDADGDMQVLVGTPTQAYLTNHGPYLTRRMRAGQQPTLEFELKRLGEGEMSFEKNWELHIRGVDGGVAPAASGLYTDEAPADGYVEELVLRGGELSRFPPNDHFVFYVRLLSVNCYARVALQVGAAGRDELRAEVSYAINAASGRALDAYGGEGLGHDRSPGYNGPWAPKRLP